MILSVFVERYIPMGLRQGRDYTGPMGWCWLMNILLRRLEVEGLISLDQRKEVGVIVDNDYWITIPTDYRSMVALHYPDFSEVKPLVDVGYDIVNGKIKLDTAVETDDDDVDEFTLSSGGAGSVVINDDDAVENQWEKSLLVLTDGTYSGDAIIIGEHDAAAVTTTLNFLHTRTTSISDSTTGYLTDVYIMLKYMAKFTGLTASSDEIPVSDEYEEALIAGLSGLASKINSEERAAFRNEFEFDLGLLKDEQFTPTSGQARPVPRPMAGLENCSDYPYAKHSDFMGDTDAWLE